MLPEPLAMPLPTPDPLLNPEPRPFAIWHPVGPHSGESLEEIVSRKQRDIDTYGFTVWAFSAAKLERVAVWKRELQAGGQSSCTAYCCGNSTKDPIAPGAEPHWCTEYSFDLVRWQELPNPRMVSYQRGPRSNGVVASGFWVRAIEAPVDMKVDRSCTWFRTERKEWAATALPTRGEYLVRRPYVSSSGIKVRLLLHLSDPFVVWVR
jgi:hypothetical protein